MNSKFYVSLEAARLLKEKGYDKDVRKFYDEDGLLLEVEGFYNFEYLTNEELDNNHVAAPTKDEAIDWLESKGIVIIVDEYYILHEEDDYYTSCWGYYIRKNDECVDRDNSSNFPTRLEAKDAAIINASKLL